AFVWKLDPSGNFDWVKQLGGPGTDVGNGVTVDGSGNVASTGAFSATGADFDPGAGTLALSSAGSNDVYVSRLAARPDVVGRTSGGQWNLGTNGGTSAAPSLTFTTYGMWNEAAGFHDELTGDFNGDGRLDV